MKKQKYKIRTVCSLNEDLNLKLNVNLITNGKTIFSKCTVLSELIWKIKQLYQNKIYF